MSLPETEVLNNLVSRVFRIEDVTSEDPRKGFFLRYRGQLLDEDSASLYDVWLSRSSHTVSSLYSRSKTAGR